MNKRMTMVAIAVMIAGSALAGMAQDAPTVSAPSIADNAKPFDDNIKMRSVELERVKREVEKTATLRRENGKELKFSVIKEDFEGIQVSQAEVIRIYTTSDPIDYQQIAKSANKITEMAVRLRANVFEPKAKEAGADAGEAADGGSGEKERNPYFSMNVRDLIVALDNVIGEVVTNPMWQKLAVVDPETAVIVETNLVKVIDASSALWIESSNKGKK